MFRSPTIFVVDDEPSVRKSIQLILERLGFEIKLFESGQAFLDDIEAADIGCLITDVRMPGMDGLQLLEQIQQLQSRLAILLLTGHGDIKMAVRAMKLGATDFLEKPVDPHSLRQKVSDALNEVVIRSGELEEGLEVKAILESLTPREREVLELLANGKSAKAIALILGTAHNTVRVQRANIIRKMKADNVVDLIRMFKLVE